MSTAPPAIAKDPRADRPLQGVLLFALATFFIVVMNAFAKKAAIYHDPAEIVFYRGLVALPLLLLYGFLTGRRNIFRTSRFKGHLGRSAAGNVGILTVIWAYSLLPMAEVTAILFVTPLVTTILSALVLKEQVGPWRWGAIIIGFSGVLLIAHPTGISVAGWGVVIALISALSTGTVDIFLRNLGRTEDALTTVFYFLSFGLVASGIYMLFRGHAPHPDAWLPLLGAGIAGGIQLILKTQAFRWAEASLLSPVTYTAIIWATLFGWLFWQDLPALPALAGTSIIIASNLFILWRERLKNKERALAPEQL